MVVFQLATAALLPSLVGASGLRGPGSAVPTRRLGEHPRQYDLAWWLPPKPADRTCMSYDALGCHTVRDRGTCLLSKDGRDKVQWAGLRIYDEPCVWCGGGPCTNNNTNLCEPYDFLYRGKGIGFSDFPNGGIGFEVGKCEHHETKEVHVDKTPAPVPAQVHSSACVAHRACAEAGLAGDCCPTPGNLTLACCDSPSTVPAPEGGESLGAAPTDLDLPTVPPIPHEEDWWKEPLPTSPAQTDCLMPHRYGCHVIRHRETCLGSKDARKKSDWYGLRIHGQPCVWCGGWPCRSGAMNLCEPMDFIINGEGVAFATFFSKSTYQAATCEAGRPAPPREIFRQPPLLSMAPVNLPTVKPWWAPEAPKPMNLACLKEETMGCRALKDRASCVTSKDAGAKETEDGLRMRGEPCVWCGGVKCHSKSDSVCEPFDYLMHGQGSAFGTFLAKFSFQVASCDGDRNIVNLPNDYDTQCLMPLAGGCGVAHDEAHCVASFDGRPQETMGSLKVRGQPCVWCGGLQCTSQTFNKCEPFDYIVNGKGRAYNHAFMPNSFRVAGCHGERQYSYSLHAFTHMVMPYWVSYKPTKDETHCLKPALAGCSQLRTMESCMTSKDGGETEHIMGLKLKGEPCVWCGGLPCTTHSKAKCAAFDYVMYGQHTAFENFLAKGIYKVASCPKPHIRLPAYDYSCLATTTGAGCNGAWDAETCLSSKDGSYMETVGTFKVRDQPCVWCGGIACHSGKTALCEAFDYAVNGESSVFNLFHAKYTFRIAACQNGKPMPATLNDFTTFVPGWIPQPRLPMYNTSWWKTPPPPTEELTCLMNHWYGCDKIAHQRTCLGSFDGRKQAQFGSGIQVEGQPCVWCGGGPCISGSTALCLPFDLVMRGEGLNYTTFFAKSHYQVAQCKDGKPLPAMAIQTSPPIVYAEPAKTYGAASAGPARLPMPAPANEEMTREMTSSDAAGADHIHQVLQAAADAVWTGGTLPPPVTSGVAPELPVDINVGTIPPSPKVGTDPWAPEADQQRKLELVTPPPVATPLYTTMSHGTLPPLPVTSTTTGTTTTVVTTTVASTTSMAGSPAGEASTPIAATAPRSVAPAQPSLVPSNCWLVCGHGGFCEFCGPGQACCKQGLATDPEECKTATGFSPSWTLHQCVPTAAVSTNAPAATAPTAPTTPSPPTLTEAVPAPVADAVATSQTTPALATSAATTSPEATTAAVNTATAAPTAAGPAAGAAAAPAVAVPAPVADAVATSQTTTPLTTSAATSAPEATAAVNTAIAATTAAGAAAAPAVGANTFPPTTPAPPTVTPAATAAPPVTPAPTVTYASREPARQEPTYVARDQKTGATSTTTDGPVAALLDKQDGEAAAAAGNSGGGGGFPSWAVALLIVAILVMAAVAGMLIHSNMVKKKAKRGGLKGRGGRVPLSDSADEEEEDESSDSDSDSGDSADQRVRRVTMAPEVQMVQPLAQGAPMTMGPIPQQPRAPFTAGAAPAPVGSLAPVASSVPTSAAQSSPWPMPCGTPLESCGGTTDVRVIHTVSAETSDLGFGPRQSVPGLPPGREFHN